MSSGRGDKQTIAPSRYFDQTAALEPGARADVVKKIVSVAEKHKLTTAGIFSNSKTFEGIFNSKGLSQWHNQTSSEISITMLGKTLPAGRNPILPMWRIWMAWPSAEIAASKAAGTAHPREIPQENTQSYSNQRPCSIWLASCSGIFPGWRSSISGHSSMSESEQTVWRQHQHLG
jgi:hypothetical protein